jgi:hypothetical protein
MGRATSLFSHDQAAGEEIDKGSDPCRHQSGGDSACTGVGGKPPVVKHASNHARIESRSRDGRRKRGDAVSLLDESQGYRDIIDREPTARTSTSTEFSPEIRRQVASLIGNDVTLAIRKS